MKNFNGKLVLVTGAGSGIGQATAIAFSRAGARLALVDLRDEGIAATEATIKGLGNQAVRYVVDVTDAKAMLALADKVHATQGVVDVLVNNAGIGASGRLLVTTLETWRKVFDVNLMGVVHGCKAFLPAMVERKQGGHVVNLASLAGYVAPADMPIYASSKYAVLGFSESLRADMATNGIGVSAICPGIIHTGIIGSTIMEGGSNPTKARDRIEKFYAKRNYGPEKVAEAILDAVRSNTGVRPVSPESWAMYYAKRLAPSVVVRMSGVDNPFDKP